MWDHDKRKSDKSGMLGMIAGMGQQLREGLEIAAEAWKTLPRTRPSGLLVAGVGGSAIGGEILRSYMLGRSRVPVVVCRDYDLPEFVGDAWLVVTCSYSGNTREALSCFEHAMARKTRLVCITSGGELLDRAERHALPHVRLPRGFPPRAALGYSFGGLLGLAWASDMAEPEMDRMEQCFRVMERATRIYSASDDRENPAILLAENLVDLVPLIYCSTRLGAVALRWKNQLCENAKRLAFVGILPEMVHNDIMGWENGPRGMRPGVVFLRTPGEVAMIASAFEFLRGLIGEHAGFWAEYEAMGTSLLSQMFSLILLGDFASAYMALLQGLDPTPIVTIDRMKSRIGHKDTED